MNADERRFYRAICVYPRSSAVSTLLRCGRSFFLFLTFGAGRSGRSFGFTGSGETKRFVLDAALLQQRRHRLARDRADAEPVLAAVELGHELLGLVLVARVVVPELFDNAPVTRAARVDRVEAVKRRI